MSNYESGLPVQFNRLERCAAVSLVIVGTSLEARAISSLGWNGARLEAW